MSDELCGALSPLLSEAGLTLVDVEVLQGLVRVTVDRSGGVDLDALTAANQIVSRALDELDPLPGRYTLEVSSPGLERRLRTPEQFQAALGETVSVRTVPGSGDHRRVQGRLSAADRDGIVVSVADRDGNVVSVADRDGNVVEHAELPDGSVRLAYTEIERARTVFEWGPAPRTSKSPKSKSRTPRSPRPPKSRATKDQPPPPKRPGGVPRAGKEKVKTQ